MNQREIFEEWHQGQHGYCHKNDFTDERWRVWQAAIASQSPKEAMSDAEIDDMIFGYAPSCPLGEGRDLSRAIEAASGPNAALVEALKKIERNEQVVFDEETNGDVIVSMGADDMIEIARAALAAVGVEP